MRKGFTLIELLAVIVILAITLVIAVPQILRVVENSKKDTFVVTTKYLIDGTKKYYSTNYDEIRSSNSKTFTIEQGAFVGDSFPMNGELPKDGIINLNPDGTLRIAVSDGSLCAYQNEYEDEVNLEEMTTGECLSTIDLVYTDASCFTFDSNTKTITDYDLTNCPMNIVIPNKINNVPVENIKPGAFINPTLQRCYDFNYNYTQVSIDYVHTDGDGYKGCYLLCPAGNITSVIFPQTLKTIGYEAFDYHQLTSIRIPDSVVDIGDWAFYGNQLTSVKLSNNLTKIRDYVFRDNQLTSITIPNTVTSIGEMAFGQNSIQSLIIPSSITKIDGSAFFLNQISSLSIPSSVTSIGEQAFNNNQLSDNEAFIYKRNPDGTIDNTTVVSYGGSKRTNVVIPNTVTKIGNNAFHHNFITGITIPNTVTDIGEWAFQCNSLGSVIFPSEVPIVRTGTFCGGGLTNITIPNGVTTIQSNSFCSNNLTSIAIPNSVTNIGNEAFKCNKIPQGSATIDRASGSVTIGTNVFNNNGTNGSTTITPVYLR